MTKENGAPTAAEKGKGKAMDDKPLDGQKQGDEAKKDKDGKPIANGTKEEEPQEGTCNILDLSRWTFADRCCRRTERGRSESQE